MSGIQDLSVFPVESQQLSVREEEVSPELQERSLYLNQEITVPLHVKEEPGELWCDSKGENIIKFTFVPVPVKIEENEEIPQSSQLYQRQTGELERGADEEDCGRPGAARCYDPEKDLQPETGVKTEDSSEAETDDSADWGETPDHQCYLNSRENVTERKKTDKKSHCCPECGKSFNYRSHLIDHMRTHTGEKPFGCSVCGKSFKFKEDVKRHMRIHTGEKPFSCSECGKRFNQKQHVRVHMKVHSGSFGCPEISGIFLNTKETFFHSEQRSFGCTECGKEFIQISDLTKHMRTHTGEKPFDCSECGKRFTLKHHLQNHMRTHTGEKPFNCSECGQRFSLQGSLTRHMLLHLRQRRVL
ncbi:gastrula zinc finger protein XlCGF8.2DB-like [Cheilinus undulatus]|uniref:gastrula zinc finger protein XlCGF8.2DB-like n=1 Tax=Cheilinus undulatus TaxID=241271 RepID=UPI001BD39B99|nr:gastrula zinc finger protein XlCGF8.2DB-like [Cheilinus undulatus]